VIFVLIFSEINTNYISALEQSRCNDMVRKLKCIILRLHLNDYGEADRRRKERIKLAYLKNSTLQLHILSV